VKLALAGSARLPSTEGTPTPLMREVLDRVADAIGVTATR
jgi:hypothetical protein